jgi:hypothetical protein
MEKGSNHWSEIRENVKEKVRNAIATDVLVIIDFAF